MVIECTECHTRFKLADDKLKPGGTKVRCSKCKQTFTVMPPAPEPEPEAPPAGPAAPEEEIDFGEFNMERLAGQPAAEPASEASASPTESFFEEEEKFVSDGGKESPSDEFAFGEDSFEQEFPASSGTSDEVSFAEEAEGGASDAFSLLKEEEDSVSDEFTFSGEKEAFDEFSFGEEAESSAKEEFAFDEKTEGETGSDAFGFESEDLSFDKEQAEGGEFSFDAAEKSDSVEFAFDEGDAGAETGTGFSWDPEEKEGGEGFDFDEGSRPTGEKDEFDFSGISFGEEDAAPAAPRVEERIAPAQPQPILIETESLSHQQPMEARAPAKPRPEFTAPPPVARRRKNPLKGVMYFIIVLLLAVTGGAVYFYWQGGIPELTSLVDRLTGQAPQAEVSGQILIEELNSFYVANPASGQMLAIQGKAINGYPQTRSSITVKGILFSKDGKPLLQQTVFCGNPLDPAELKKLPFAKIEEKMNNPFGESLSNLNVAPGKAIPFTIVFRNLPADLAEFTVEAAESKPGTKQ